MNNKVAELQGEEGWNRPHNPPAMFSPGNSDTNLVTPEEKNQSRAMKRLRDAIFELASSNQTHPLSMEKTKHIEARLRQIFPVIRTPDHPPYSEMIYKAIEALNEEGGSTKASVSSYITSQYHDLPWAHNAILSHHLDKLKQSGDIVVTSNSCYLFPKPNPNPDPKTTQQRRRQGLPRKKPEELEQVIQEAVLQEPQQPTTRRRGRPPKPKPETNTVTKELLKQKQEEMEKQEPKGGRGRSTSLKSKPVRAVKEEERVVEQAKRRGRGKTTSSLASSEATMGMGVMLASSQEEQKQQEVKQRKRRGRPPKPKPTPTMETLPTKQEQQPRRRGRPRKERLE